MEAKETAGLPMTERVARDCSSGLLETTSNRPWNAAKTNTHQLLQKGGREKREGERKKEQDKERDEGDRDRKREAEAYRRRERHRESRRGRGRKGDLWW